MRVGLPNQITIVLSLGVLVSAAIALPARAEPAQEKGEVAAAPAKDASSARKAADRKEGPQEVTEVQTRTVTLPADMPERGRNPRRRLMYSSAGLFALGYVPAAVTAIANSKNTSGWLGCPIVGPWIDWGPNTSPGNKTLLFLSGTFQAVGLVGFVSSFFISERQAEKVPMMGRGRMSLAPVAGQGTYALSASGTF